MVGAFSPFAIALIVFLAVAFASCKKRKDFAVVLFGVSCIMSMNMIMAPLVFVGGQEITCGDLVLVLFVLFALAAVAKKNIILNRYALAAALCVIAVLSCSLVYNFLFPYEGTIVASGTSWDMLVQGAAFRSVQEFGSRNLLVLLRYVLFLISGVLAISLFDRNDFTKIGRWSLVVGKLHICYALFELATKAMLGLNIASQITAFVFADNYVFTVYLVRDSLVALWGMTREPSHFVLALGFYVFIFLLMKNSGQVLREKTVWPIAAVLLLCVSGASSVVVLLPSLAFFAIVLRQISRKEKVRIMPIIFTLAILTLGVYILSETEFGRSLPYFEKALSVVNSLGIAFHGDYSALPGVEGMARMASIVDSLRVWVSSPLFGIGVGSVNPFSGVFSQLVNTGIVGFVAWLAYLRSIQRVSPARHAYLLFMAVVVGTMTFIGDGASVYSFSLLLIAPLISCSLQAISENNKESEQVHERFGHHAKRAVRFGEQRRSFAKLQVGVSARFSSGGKARVGE